MSVPEQTPFIEYTANGTTTIFPLTFDCSTSDYLVVKVNGVLQLAGTWILFDGSVVFEIAPIAGSLVSIQRVSSLKRTTSYTSYDNSFRPEPVDKDFDNIWYVLQEFALQNSLTLDKFQELIDKLVDGEINGLPAEILARIAGDEENTLLINQEVLRAYSVEIGLQLLINQETSRAITTEQWLQNQVDSIVVGNKAYRTYALMDADKANIPINSKVSVTNDVDTTKNIDWQWNGVDFAPAPLSVLNQAKAYTNSKVDALIRETDSTVPTVPLVDVDGWFYGAFYEDGSLETPLFKLSNYYANGFLVLDEDGWILLEQSSSSSVPKDWAHLNVLIVGDSISETSNVEAGIYNSLAFRQNWFLYAFAMLEVKEFNNMARSGASYREYAGQLTWQKISHQVSTAISTGFKPDIVIAAAGTNDIIKNPDGSFDYSHLGDYDTAMGKDIGSLDMDITADALRKNFYTISQAYPNAKLFACLPLQRADTETSARQPLLDLIRKMAGRYGLTVIDCHNETGIVKDFEIWNASGRDLVDGLHPKNTGQIKQAKTIASKIKANYQLQV